MEEAGGLAAISFGFSQEFILLVLAVVVLFLIWKLGHYLFAFFN